MHVTRIGFTPVKGGRHRAHGSVVLTETGPMGDRAFCLVDPDAGRCLRTVENPTLLQTAADWDGAELSVRLPSGTVVDRPVPTGDVRTVDYWGRAAAVEVVAGPWADAYSTHLGRDVVLAASAPGAVVYGAAVTLVTTSSLVRLADELGAPVDAARFRATFRVDTGDLPPHVEDGWVGRRLRVGGAEVRVRSLVPRCAVVDLDPGSGARNRPVLEALARYRRRPGEVVFGVDAEVTVPGVVDDGDLVEPSGD